MATVTVTEHIPVPLPLLTIHLALNLEEAAVIRMLVGRIGHTGPVRKVASDIQEQLDTCKRVEQLSLRIQALAEKKLTTKLPFGDIVIPYE